MSKFFAPLVGMHFRPPAKALLACLPSGCALALRLEPDNPHDPNAVQVLVRSADIPETQDDVLAGQLPGMGYALTDVRGDDAKEEWHLGYVARTHALSLAPALAKAAQESNEPDVDWPAALSFAADGKPQVGVELPGVAEDAESVAGAVEGRR